ncbi:MAG TPA: SRPBCC domain-containing protein [Anaerolineales bacterium]
MYAIEDSVEILATPAAVWRVLEDLHGWSAWRSFVSHDGGTLKTGETLSVTLSPPGGLTVTFDPVTTEVEPEKEISWRNRMMAGLFDTRHSFRIDQAEAGRVLFVQQSSAEDLCGCCAPWASCRRAPKGCASSMKL